MDTELLELLEEASSVQAHIDNDLFKNVPQWKKQREQVFRQLAEYYDRELADGAES